MHAEPGLEYEVVVKLKPPFKFEHVKLAPNEKRTLTVTGNGTVEIQFMDQLHHRGAQRGRQGGQLVPLGYADVRSDRALQDPRGGGAVSETTIDDIMVAPNGTYTEKIHGFGTLQINTPDRGLGPFGMYVFDDHKKQDIGSYLTALPMVMPMGRYTLKSVGNSILKNVYPDPAKVLQIPLPPAGRTVTFARKEDKQEIAKEDKENGGDKGPVMLDSLTPEQIKQHLEEQEKNGMAP